MEWLVLLNNNEVKTVSRQDLVAKYVGRTIQNVNRLLNETGESVIMIDDMDST